jgi:hypothetical protein
MHQLPQLLSVPRICMQPKWQKTTATINCHSSFLHLQFSFVLAGGFLPIGRPSSPWATSALNSLLTLPFPTTTNWRAEPLQRISSFR